MKNEKQEIAENLVKYLNNVLIREGKKPVETRKRPIPVPQKERNVKQLKKQGKSLDLILEQVLNCKKCILYKTKKNYVFGMGNPKARLMFIGEAPGYSEDVQGLPFVGRAGQLLDKILNAMGLTRKDVYIANVLKCRPPENRNPLPEEIEACCGYLEKQIEQIKPEVICALGLFAGQFLTNNPMVRIGEIRGKEFEYKGIPVIPTYHPAYLLRNPSQKKVVWEDMILIMKKLGMKNQWTESEEED